MLLSKGKITPDHINLLRFWNHSGFQVFCGPRIHPREKESQIIYRSKDNRQEKIFDALDWLAAPTSHIPNHREQMVRYYGFYSNASRGFRQKEKKEALIHMEILYGSPHLTWSSLYISNGNRQ